MTRHVALVLLFVGCVTHTSAPQKEPLFTEADLPPDPINEVVQPKEVFFDTTDCRPVIDEFGFKVCHRKFTAQEVTDYLMRYNLQLARNIYQSDIIVLPGGGTLLGAPTQLNCQERGKPSYDCRIIDIMQISGITYLVARRQLYRYDPKGDCEDKLVWVSSFEHELTTLEDQGAILAVDDTKTVGLVLHHQGSWYYEPIEKRQQVNKGTVTGIQRLNTTTVRITRGKRYKPIVITVPLKTPAQFVGIN